MLTDNNEKLSYR